MNQITYDKLKKMVTFFEEHPKEEIFKHLLPLPYSQNKKEWPTLGDFKRAVKDLGLIYVSS